jgi:hypothetical protein
MFFNLSQNILDLIERWITGNNLSSILFAIKLNWNQYLVLFVAVDSNWKYIYSKRDLLVLFLCYCPVSGKSLRYPLDDSFVYLSEYPQNSVEFSRIQ